MTETFYDLLGVPEDATTGEIEDAYRESVKQVHPDVSDDVDAGERTKRLNKAKRVLTDEGERARYDRVGHAAYTGDGDPSDAARETGQSGDSAEPDADDGRAGSDGAGDWATGDPRDRDRTGKDIGGGRRRRRARGRHVRNGGADDGHDRTAPWDESSGDDRSRDRSADSAGTNGSDWTGRAARSGSERRRTRRPGDGVVGGTSAPTGAGESPSARRQAAAGTTDGPNADASWNGWERTRSWAVRQGQRGGRHVGTGLFPPEQPVVLLASTFLLYPVFVATVLFPAFPLVARAAVGVCTLLMFAYLLSVPRTAVVVFGLWSVVAPVTLLVHPGLDLVSVTGLVGLSVTWVPLGLSLLTLSALR